MKGKQTIVMMGAGPAGLIAAYELSKSDWFEALISESEYQLRGISFFQVRLVASVLGVIFTHCIYSFLLKSKKEVLVTDGKDDYHSDESLLVRPGRTKVYYNQYLLKLNFKYFIGNTIY